MLWRELLMRKNASWLWAKRMLLFQASFASQIRRTSQSQKFRKSSSWKRRTGLQIGKGWTASCAGPDPSPVLCFCNFRLICYAVSICFKACLEHDWVAGGHDSGCPGARLGCPGAQLSITLGARFRLPGSTIHVCMQHGA